MDEFPAEIGTLEQLEEMLSKPTPKLVDYFSELQGDIAFLGVGGKIGPSLARMARLASDKAGTDRQIFGVSRFSNPSLQKQMQQQGIETIRGDLLDADFVRQLPRVENVVFLAGNKFGSTDNTAFTWAMNVYVPGLVAEQFRNSRIVAYSTGAVYPFVQIESGGATEDTPPKADGEYSQSCLGRERMFEYGSAKFGTPTVLIRLNYAVEMRYGVLVDIGLRVKNKQPIDLTMGFANVVWQGDANAVVLQCFSLCESPARILNVTGPETISIRRLANRFGELYGIDPVFENEESDTAWLSDATQCQRLFGYPNVPLDQIIIWTSKWIEKGLPLLNKPTHFETRNGKF